MRSHLFASLAFLAFALLGSGQAQSLQNITVVVQNPTSGTLNFSYKVGGDDWMKIRLEPGYTQTFKGIGPHLIRYHNGQQVIPYTLSSSKTYYFTWQNGVLNFYHR